MLHLSLECARFGHRQKASKIDVLHLSCQNIAINNMLNIKISQLEIQALDGIHLPPFITTLLKTEQAQLADFQEVALQF